MSNQSSNAARNWLRDLFETDADEIVSARKRGRVVAGADISQSGTDVEHAVRHVLTQRLPTAYSIGHGHVVDKSLDICGQFDVIVSDRFANPLLFSTKGQSDWVPIEAVYAVGEVKSRYDKHKRPFEMFVKHLEHLRSLDREIADKNFFLIGGKGRGASIPGWSSDARDYKNPIFSFMFFVESDQFKPSDVSRLYKTTDPKYLPNIVCFLDSGIIALNQFDSAAEKTLHFHGAPEFAHIYDARSGSKSNWIMHKAQGERKRGGHLGWLYYMLASHLHYSTLRPADPMDYAYSILSDPNYSQELL